MVTLTCPTHHLMKNWSFWTVRCWVRMANWRASIRMRCAPDCALRSSVIGADRPDGTLLMGTAVATVTLDRHRDPVRLVVKLTDVDLVPWKKGPSMCWQLA